MHVINSFFNSKEQTVKNYIFQGGSVKGLCYGVYLTYYDFMDMEYGNGIWIQRGSLT
jgi:hypothetical protein